MTISDYLSIAALLVSLASAAYSRFQARENTRVNELAFREEWLEVRDTLFRVQKTFLLEGGFNNAKKNGFPSNLDESLFDDLRRVAKQAEKWADHAVYEYLTETIGWANQLNTCFEESTPSEPEDKMAPERKAQLDRHAVNCTDNARKALGTAIDIVKARLDSQNHLMPPKYARAGV